MTRRRRRWPGIAGIAADAQAENVCRPVRRRPRRLAGAGMMLSLYVPGNSLLHRLPAGWKLGGLCLAGLLVYLLAQPVWLLAAAALAALLLWRSGAGWRRIWRQGRALLCLILLLCAFMAIFDSPARAGVAALRVGTVCMLGMAVTFTTRSGDLLQVVERVLQPLQRLGWVDAGRVALAIGLVLRFVPEILRQYGELREAQQARGLKARGLALLVPLIVRTLRRAEEISDAIDARDGGGRQL